MGEDTTFVLRGPSYYLLASQRSVLWHKAAVDDAAWRYRWLFGAPPPLVAIRLDSAAIAADSAASWRGVPLVVARVANVRNATQPRPNGAGMVSSRHLTSRAGRAWLGIAGRDSAAVTASTRVRYPAWFELGAIYLLGSVQPTEGFDDEPFGTRRSSISLAALFDVPPESEAADGSLDTRSSTTRRQNPYFAAQAASVLSFLRERDAAFVATLPRQLARGRSMVELLSTSTALPHDLSVLDAQWRRWAQRAARSASR